MGECLPSQLERTLQLCTGWVDFTLMMECMPESGHCHSVYSKGKPSSIWSLDELFSGLPTSSIYCASNNFTSAKGLRTVCAATRQKFHP